MKRHRRLQRKSSSCVLSEMKSPNQNHNNVANSCSANEMMKDQFVAHIQQLNHKVSALQQQLSQSKQQSTKLQTQVVTLESQLTKLNEENTMLRKQVEELQTLKQEFVQKQCNIQKLNLLERESSLKEFEIRDLRENLIMHKYISNHLALTQDRDQKRHPGARLAPKAAAASYASSNVSTISLLQRKYERSEKFEPKNGLELPIKLFDCYSDDDGSNVEIDIVKIPSSQEVRIRVRFGEIEEDLDIRDVYANVVSERVFHLETFDNGYYLCSRQSHITCQEVVDDINAFQSDGFLPERVQARKN